MNTKITGGWRIRNQGILASPPKKVSRADVRKDVFSSNDLGAAVQVSKESEETMGWQRIPGMGMVAICLLLEANRKRAASWSS